MSQVQLRLPPNMLKVIDEMVSQGKYKSRSDAIRIMVGTHIEWEKNRDFLLLLQKRSDEARKNPDILIPFDD